MIAKKNCSTREELEPIFRQVSKDFLEKHLDQFVKNEANKTKSETKTIQQLATEYTENKEKWDIQIEESQVTRYIIRPVLDLIKEGFINISDSDKDDLTHENQVSVKCYENKDSESLIYYLEGWRNRFELSHLTNLFTKKDDFDYFLKTGRRLCDSKEDKRGIILSKAFGDTRHVYKDYHLFVESVNNIISYFEVHNLFVQKGFRDWEIDFAIDCLVENSKVYLLTEKYVYDDGYCSIRNPSEFVNVFSKKEKYEKFFFFRKQVEQIPQIYFDRHFTYEEVLQRWNLSQERADKILIELIDPDDIWIEMKLEKRVNFPRHKELRVPYNKDWKYDFPNQNDETIRVGFIKSSVFPNRYLSAVESHYSIPKRIHCDEQSNLPRGRKPKFDEVLVWKSFIENLGGSFDESELDYAAQAYDAFDKLTQREKDALGFIDKNRKSPFRKIIINKLSEIAKLSSQEISDRTLGDKIADKFIKKFPKNSRL